MNDDHPLVSIGLPVFNEGRFIRQSLESLISQDYKNIEIIISDNASTDNTRKICEEVEREYSNIRYYRFDQNLGAVKNFNYVFECAKGKYFTWASGHDLWSSNYIRQCVKELEENKDAVIAFATTLWIDGCYCPLFHNPVGKHASCAWCYSSFINALYSR